MVPNATQEHRAACEQQQQELGNAITFTVEKCMPLSRTSFQHPGYSYIEYESTTTTDQIRSRIQEASIIITTRVPLDATSISLCKNLHLIAVMAAGTDIIDKEACKSRGIAICNIPSASAESVAEHAFALYFAVKRKIVQMHQCTIRGEVWPVKRTAIHLFEGLPMTWRSEVLGIIGYGVLGKRVETIAKALDMAVLIADRKGVPTKSTRPGRTSFLNVIQESTVLVLTCPLDESTRDMISEAEFRCMQEQCVLINVARGGIVVEEDLVQALKEGWIKGAATDVFATEPADASTSPLITEGDEIPNLTLSPHVAWYASSSIENLQVTIKSNIEGYLAGNPQNII